MHDASFVTDAAWVLGFAALTSVVARKLKQPSILGYLLAGLIVGPYVPLPIFADPHRIESMAEFGVVLVMFAVGLEFRLAKLVRVLPTSGLTGLLQVSFLLSAGFTVGDLLGWSSVESLFLGGCVAISSTMVVSKVFEEKPVPQDVRELVFGVLIFQDVVAIVLIAVLTAVAAGGGLGAWELTRTVGQLAGVLLAMVVGGMFFVPRAIRRVVKLESLEILVVVAIGLCFMMAYFAKAMGYSVALGAFIAGILVAESGKAKKVEHLVQPLRDVFAAIFFVSIGMSVDPVQAVHNFPISLLLFAVVVLAQLGVVTVAGLLTGNGLRRSMKAGLALGQIGEFAFIIAQIGIAAGVVRASLQPIVVTVAVLSAFTTPIFLGYAARVVSFTDHVLPDRFLHLIGVYEGWLARRRTESESPTDRRSMNHAIKVIAFDALALIGVVALGLLAVPRVQPLIVQTLALPDVLARTALIVGLVVISAPFGVGLVRSTRALSALLVASVESAREAGGEGSPLAAGALRTILYLVVLLTIGLPAAAVLKPLGAGKYGLLVVFALVGVGLVSLWRRAGNVEGEFRSAAERIASALSQPSAAAETSLVGVSVIPGLDVIRRIALEPGAYAVGRTLAELDLRAETGANVIAIHRADGNSVLPTGHERLGPGDALAVAATAEELLETERLLTSGPSVPAEELPAMAEPDEESEDFAEPA